MKFFENLKIKKLLKKIEPEVDEKLIELGDLTIDENGKKIYKMGSANVIWQIQKDILKEKYGIEWKSPQEKNPNINYD